MPWVAVISLDKFTEELATYEKLFVGLSGGVDSIALLHTMSQLPAIKHKIHTIHINHGLSKHADLWQTFCIETCHQYDIPISIHNITTQLGSSQHNLEARAREARYKLFSSYIKENTALLLAHHQDDLVETFFLNLLRGAGLDGLCAMPESRSFAQGKLLRPLLEYDKNSLIAYAKKYDLHWVEDESNQDLNFRRNFIRHKITPELKKYWPSCNQNITRSIKLLQQAQTQLSAQNKSQFAPLCQGQELLIAKLANEADAPALLRFWFQELAITCPAKKVLDEILATLVKGRTDSKATVCFGQWQIRRYRGTLYLEKMAKQETTTEAGPKLWKNLGKPLLIKQPKQLIKLSLQHSSPATLYIPPNAQIEVRFRQGGETIKLNYQTKKVKKLLQTSHIPSWQRASLPLLYIDNELAAISNYYISDHFKHGTNQADGYKFDISYLDLD